MYDVPIDDDSLKMFRDPVATAKAVSWTFPTLPKEASAKLLLDAGKRRPCCFDRSGTYSNSLSCPVADDTSSDT